MTSSSIKFSLNGEVHRDALPKQALNYEHLITRAKALFPFLSSPEGSKFNFAWTDEEGELIQLTLDEELLDAITTMKYQNKIMRFEIVVKSLNSNRMVNSIGTSIPSQTPVQEKSSNSYHDIKYSLLRINWINPTTLIENSISNVVSPIFKLDFQYIADSGLHGKNLVLYRRDQFQVQFKFLESDVIAQSHIGWILGPPGTGKSSTSLAFASTLDRNVWAITWIHLSKQGPPTCIRFEMTEKTTCFLFNSDIFLLYSVLNEYDDGRKKHIVFLDGFVGSITEHKNISNICHGWAKNPQFTGNRRLVVICSMSSGNYVSASDSKYFDIEELLVHSWNREDYIHAILHDDVYHSVVDNLDAVNHQELHFKNLSDNEFRIELIESKLFYSGGCSRFMFDYKTEE
eukprot:gene12591-26513_t